MMQGKKGVATTSCVERDGERPPQLGGQTKVGDILMTIKNDELLAPWQLMTC